MTTAKISLRIDSDLLGRAQSAAQEKGESLSEYIKQAIRIKLRREGCA